MVINTEVVESNLRVLNVGNRITWTFESRILSSE